MGPEDVAAAYRQVASEVPGSPIFVMRLAPRSRHLEVQLLADTYGQVLLFFCFVLRDYDYCWLSCLDIVGKSGPWAPPEVNIYWGGTCGQIGFVSRMITDACLVSGYWRSVPRAPPEAYLFLGDEHRWADLVCFVRR